MILKSLKMDVSCPPAILETTSKTILYHSPENHHPNITHIQQCCSLLVPTLPVLLRFAEHASPHNLTNNTTRCTILFKYIYIYIYLFISLLYMFWASKCPSSGENHCIYVTLVFVTPDGWHLVGWLYPTSRPDATHPE